MLTLRSQIQRLSSLLAAAALACAGVPAVAVEVLPARDLAGHCKSLSSSAESAGAQFCTHYVQGFIDGAVSTDVRVMMNIEAEYEEGASLTEQEVRDFCQLLLSLF